MRNLPLLLPTLHQRLPIQHLFARLIVVAELLGVAEALLLKPIKVLVLLVKIILLAEGLFHDVVGLAGAQVSLGQGLRCFALVDLLVAPVALPVLHQAVMLHPVVDLFLRHAVLHPQLVLQLDVQKFIFLEEVVVSGVLKQFHVASFHVVEALEEDLLAELAAQLGTSLHLTLFVALLLAR